MVRGGQEQDLFRPGQGGPELGEGGLFVSRVGRHYVNKNCSLSYHGTIYYSGTYSDVPGAILFSQIRFLQLHLKIIKYIHWQMSRAIKMLFI